MRISLLLLAAVLTLALVPASHAADKKDDDGRRSGNKKKPAPPAEDKNGAISGSATVQLQPIMVPYRGSTGIHYEVVTIRIELPEGLNQKTACSSIPIVHDRMVSYVYGANLTADDFVGERRDLLAKNLFDVAVQFTGRGYYSKLELPGPDAPELDAKSQTLSTQCK